MILEMEDADIVLDLRHLNSGRTSLYDVFWSECKKFLEEVIGSAVDDRRHASVTHLAKVISIRYLRDQVQAKRCAFKRPPCNQDFLWQQQSMEEGFNFSQTDPKPCEFHTLDKLAQVMKCYDKLYTYMYHLWKT